MVGGGPRTKGLLVASLQQTCVLSAEALVFPLTVMVEVCIKQTDLKGLPGLSGAKQPLGPLLLDSVT